MIINTCVVSQVLQSFASPQFFNIKFRKILRFEFLFAFKIPAENVGLVSIYSIIVCLDSIGYPMFYFWILWYDTKVSI